MTDAHSADGRFGEERLHELLRERAGAPPDVLLAALDADLDAFRAGPQADDTAAVALARREPSARRLHGRSNVRSTICCRARARCAAQIFVLVRARALG